MRHTSWYVRLCLSGEGDRMDDRPTEVIPVVGDDGSRREYEAPPPPFAGKPTRPRWSPRPSYYTNSSLRNTRVLVLGGTSGIGAACVELAIKMGFEVEFSGREDYHVNDYTRLRQHLIDFRPTHMVYSVGVNILQWSKFATKDDFLAMMMINVWGFVEAVQVLQDMHATINAPYRPSVVAISSDAARRPMRTSLSYCASKAALDQAVRVLARELASEGWRINAVAPGKVLNTNMTHYVDAKVRELRGWTKEFADAYERSSNALGMPAMPDAVAQVVMDVLFGPMSMNGAIVEINGGR